MQADLLPARVIKHNNHTGFANEVGPHNPRLQKRFLDNPVAKWSAQYLTGDDRHPTPEFHLDITDILMKEKRSCITAYRSGGKTTKLKEYLCFLACEMPNIRRGHYPDISPVDVVRFLTMSGDKARVESLWIKNQLDNNPLILADYGRLAGSEIWTQKAFKTRTGFYFSAAGRNAQVRGYRPKLLILDDIDDDDELRNDELFLQGCHWFNSEVYNTIDEDDYQIFVIGTMVEEVSLLSYIGNKPAFSTYGFHCYDQGIEQAGRENWPSKWSHKRLQVQKDNIGFRSFQSEFKGEPQPSENPLFERHWFKPYDPEGEAFKKLEQRGFYTVEAGDPATRKADKSDFQAFVTLSVTQGKFPAIFMRTNYCGEGHWPTETYVQKMADVYERSHAHELGIETNAYQDVLVERIDAYCEQKRKNISITEITATADKETRANSVTHFPQAGQVFYDPNDPIHLRIIDQCVLFKAGKVNIKKDLMDAFVYALMLVQLWIRRLDDTEEEEGGRIALPRGATIKKHTGVVA